MQTKEVTISTPFELWPWQERAIKRFAYQHHAFLKHIMGAGKTVTTLLLISLIKERYGRVPRSLILAPCSTLWAWEREARSVFPEFADSMMVLEQTTEKKLKVFDEGYTEGKRVIVTNHESMISPNIVKRIRALKIELLVIDESQKMKSAKSKRVKAMFPIADKAQYKYLLSGTPVTNEAEDIWAQLRMFGPGVCVPENFYSFIREYFYDKNAAWAHTKSHFPDYQLNPNRADAFRAMIASVMDVVEEADVTSLPPLVRAPRYVSLSSSIEKIYRGVERDFLAVLGDDAISVDMALTRLTRLLQICSGVVKTDAGEELFLPTEKLEALEEILVDITPTEKVIIWTPWRATYKPIVELCKRLKIKGVHASTAGGAKRQEMVDMFQNDPEVRVFLANPASMGVGVNLQAASTMVYFAKTFNLEHDQQSEARARRGNSVHAHIKRIDLITRDTEEERVEEALRKKVSLQSYIFSRKSGREQSTETTQAVTDVLNIFYGTTG